MAFVDPPYVVEKTDHSARLFRRQFQQSVGEGSGVSRPGDLKVQALNVPGNGFRVAPGGGIAQSRDTATSMRESYGPVNAEEIVVTDVPGTTSSGGRRDLVIVEITDPAMQSVSYPEPSDPAYTGAWLLGSTFARITVIPGVAADVKSLDQITTGDYKNVTGVTLAAINWPASASTIGPGDSPSAGMASIEDLRRVHRPRMEPVAVNFSLTGSAVDSITATSAYPGGGQTWPLQAESAGQLDVDIPDWATHVQLEATFYGVLYPGGDAWGSVWLQIGATVNPANVKSQDSRWDTGGAANGQRATIGFADTVAIPAALRGTKQRFYPRATRYGGTSAATARMDRVSSIAIKGWFIERAV